MIGKKFLTNHLFKRWFNECAYPAFKDGDFITANNCTTFIFSDENGNPQPVKRFLGWITGFWDIVAVKNSVVVHMDREVAHCDVYYKNCLRRATRKEILRYKTTLGL
jgi:hypothetical protein